MDNAEKFDAWAIVEAMGFKKLAGHVTEQSIAGASLIRVDVPEVVIGDRTYPAYSKLIGAGSIYMITPTDEETARKAAKVLAAQTDPLPLYIPPEPKQLPARTNDVERGHLTDDDFDSGDDYDFHDDPIAEQLQQDAIDEQLDAEARAEQAAEGQTA